MNWLKRILDKSEPLSNYGNDAASWERCAIAEARGASLSDVVVGLGAYSAPYDDALTRLGTEFCRAVRRGRRSEALRLYLAIQRRLAKLARV